MYSHETLQIFIWLKYWTFSVALCYETTRSFWLLALLVSWSTKIRIWYFLFWQYESWKPAAASVEWSRSACKRLTSIKSLQSRKNVVFISLYTLLLQIFLKSVSLNLLEPSGPVQTCNGIALSFTCVMHFYLLVPLSCVLRMEKKCSSKMLTAIYHITYKKSQHHSLNLIRHLMSK